MFEYKNYNLTEQFRVIVLIFLSFRDIRILIFPGFLLFVIRFVKNFTLAKDFS